jgi:hypothetical protein
VPLASEVVRRCPVHEEHEQTLVIRVHVPTLELSPLPIVGRVRLFLCGRCLDEFELPTCSLCGGPQTQIQFDPREAVKEAAGVIDDPAIRRAFVVRKMREAEEAALTMGPCAFRYRAPSGELTTSRWIA